MNIAMNLYSQYFYKNYSDSRFDELRNIIEEKTVYTSKKLPNGYEEFKFSDNSKLIFTHDNVQVTLF